MSSLVGKGSFGKVVAAEINGHACAVKVEKRDAKMPQLEYEGKVLMLLRGCPGIPTVFRYWEKADRYLAMELHGDNLEVALRKKRLPPERVYRVVVPQLLRILQDVHRRGFLHRDIKPQNVLLGRHDEDRVYLIDFGLSKKYLNADGTHIPFKDGTKRVVGNLRYCALNIMLKNESSRRDDLEAAGYMFVYLAKGGTLPWMDIEKKTSSPKVICDNVRAAKVALDVEDLCGDLPVAYKHYLLHVRALGFDQRPDYAFIRSLFAASDPTPRSDVGAPPPAPSPPAPSPPAPSPPAPSSPAPSVAAAPSSGGSSGARPRRDLASSTPQ